ncbi:glycine oxidase ThiO [Acidomonas methanolica]|nr:glycine oxidase ThiO [Acidomonas methanolica]MBU2653183.1 glycine oxidase ThiO [Acidomonas methanolica]TCS32132.1 glycine oxidase [Acidomonas methanolica]
MSGRMKPEILVSGAGVAGLVTAVILAERGGAVCLHEAGARIGSGASWMAGGMLAPWCEAESAPEEITRDSLDAVGWWRAHVPECAANGTLVVAPPRDLPELARFARRTSHFETLDGRRIAALEPDLADRFDKGLFFPEEAHLDPRAALVALRERLIALGGKIFHGEDRPAPEAFDWHIDCTGIAARDSLRGLRGMRGEMLLLRCPELHFRRPVRLLHPRIPVYIVPRAESVFMVGATMIEAEDSRGITVRSMTDLLNAAYALHPAFAEAEIIEANAGLRPSFPDNIPKVIRDGWTIHVNGMYRHGFLLSPARGMEVAAMVFGAE